MTLPQRIIYGLVMAVAVFAVGQFVLGVGTLIINILFALAMGAFAIFMVTLAAKFSKRGE